MKNFLVVFDKFKGTLTANEVCDIVSGQLKKRIDGANVKSIAISDGGEGFIDAFLSVFDGERVFCKVKDPFFCDIDAQFAMLKDKTAIIESSEACGLRLVFGRADTKNATTFGVGQLILEAMKRGAKRIFVGLGGSSSTDGGAGMAAALGAKFFDKNGVEFVPVGKNLADVWRVDLQKMRVPNCQIMCFCDVKNPLCGQTGAAFAFAKQKGATDLELPMLEAGLRWFSEISQKAAEENQLNSDFSGDFSSFSHVDIANVQGAGAAGGLGFGIMCFLKGKILWGIEEILKIFHFDTLVKNSQLVITGEGKFDSQSLLGKAVLGVCNTAKKYAVPVALVVGCIEGVCKQQLVENGIVASFVTNKTHQTDINVLKTTAKQDLLCAVDQLVDSILGGFA